MKKTAHILLADDEQNILHFMKKTLEFEGFSVYTASDGQTALDILEEKMPDMVILDIRMPGMNGYQVLRSIRARSEVPVLMASALLDETAPDADLSLSADDYIAKPFSPEQLVARIKARLK